MSERITRAQVWKQLGAPSDQIGSVNEPRETLENGHAWNEKWVYRSGANGAAQRVVLWNRYDFLGVFRVGDDGSLAEEPLPEASGLD